jgi:GTP-binding protein
MEIIAAGTQIIRVETDMIRKKTLTIALVGRPNTGKSTLFNRLTSSNNAIVSAVPGTTRDRKQEKGSLAGLPLVVMDTGGLDDRGAISIQIQDQVQQALLTADVVLFMLDARTGVTSLDDYFAKWLRKKLGQIEKSEAQKLLKINATISKEDLKKGAISDSVRAATISQARSAKEIIVIANKTEGAHLSPKVLDCLADALKLGLGDPIPISAVHGEGMADLAQILLEIARKKGYNDGDEVLLEYQYILVM